MFQEQKKTRVGCEECEKGYGGVFTPSPYGDNIWDSPATYPGVRCQWRLGRDIFCVLPTGAEFGGISGRRVPGEGE